MHRRSQRRLALLVLAGFTPLLAVAAEPAAPERGSLWEMTSQMSMEGAPMALPVQKMKVCAKNDEPPVNADERHKCTNSDFKKEGSTVTWKTVCAGPPEMTGLGEITFSDADNYAGTIKFTSSKGNMTTKLTGKRTGECELKGR